MPPLRSAVDPYCDLSDDGEHHPILISNSADPDRDDTVRCDDCDVELPRSSW